MTGLPYRRNVGAVLFNGDGLVLVARRAHLPNAEAAAGGWQLPQGGIDEDEEPRAAIFRELPEELIGKAFKGRFRGQRQKWFALRFLGADSEIRLDADPHPEFDAWRWVEIAELPGLAVSFKRPIYEVLARDFAPFAK